MALTLLLGGARSGKSALAVRWGKAHRGPVVFIATGEAGDDEMARRIARHRAERPDGWTTVEEPRDLATVIAAAERRAFVIVDCLTLWLANMLDDTDADVMRAAGAIAAAASARRAPTVVISNEVGLGIVPADHVTRRYRDLLGEVNAMMAGHSERALLLVAGRAVALTDDASQPPGPPAAPQV